MASLRGTFMATTAPLDRFIADNALLDPESADGFLEPLNKRRLWKTWRDGRARSRRLKGRR